MEKTIIIERRVDGHTEFMAIDHVIGTLEGDLIDTNSDGYVYCTSPSRGVNDPRCQKCIASGYSPTYFCDGCPHAYFLA